MIKSALIVSPAYAERIASGHKRWELRSTACHKREQVGIIAAGTGTIVGVATVVATHGPLSLSELQDAGHLHRASMNVLIENPKWVHAWEFGQAKRLETPIPYDHPNGAQGWVNIDPVTALRVAYQSEPSVRGRLSATGGTSAVSQDGGH